MRRLKFMLLLIVGGLFIATSSCSNDDDASGGNNNAASGTLTAKVDGTSFRSMEISSSATLANTGSTSNLIIIASNSDGNAFAITIFGYTGPGTYGLTGADPLVTNVASYTETDLSNISNPTTEIWQAPYDSTDVGSVTITEETDSNVKGTFSFSCKNVNGDNSVKNVTEGAFDLDKQTT